MNLPPRMGFADALQLAFVVALAAALRIGFINLAADSSDAVPYFAVQGAEPFPDAPRDKDQIRPFDSLVRNLAEQQWFGSQTPLADKNEATAHVAPGYPWIVAPLTQLDSPAHGLVRWLQCGLGSLTVGMLFLFARRAFSSSMVALLAGVLGAIHPFWIVNTAELNDGVVTTFLLVTALWLGTRGGQSGGACTSFVFGLSLAGLPMVRAATLPFAFLGVLWFLYQCRHVRHGWFNAILALLGFANGLAPWAVRNWRAYDEPVPIVTTTYLHLWIGNNPAATGGPLDEATLRKSLAPERLQELLEETNQAKRYTRLGRDSFDEIVRDPAAAAAHRWQAGLRFLLGDAWFREQRMSQTRPAEAGHDSLAPPEWLADNLENWLQGGLLALGFLGLLGWRTSYAWKKNSRLATLAFIWLPLPYLLGHAEDLSGPRLPWDAVLICYSAYALACILPTVAGGAEEE